MGGLERESERGGRLRGRGADQEGMRQRKDWRESEMGRETENE